MTPRSLAPWRAGAGREGHTSRSAAKDHCLTLYSINPLTVRVGLASLAPFVWRRIFVYTTCREAHRSSRPPFRPARFAAPFGGARGPGRSAPSATRCGCSGGMDVLTAQADPLRCPLRGRSRVGAQCAKCHLVRLQGASGRVDWEGRRCAAVPYGDALAAERSAPSAAWCGCSERVGALTGKAAAARLSPAGTRLRRSAGAL